MSNIVLVLLLHACLGWLHYAIMADCLFSLVRNVCIFLLFNSLNTEEFYNFISTAKTSSYNYTLLDVESIGNRANVSVSYNC